MPTTSTPGPSAPTRVPATAPPELATASLDMMALLARELSATTTVTTAALAGPRSTWLPRSDALTLLLGMP
jgi:hypothetical protein